MSVLFPGFFSVFQGSDKVIKGDGGKGQRLGGALGAQPNSQFGYSLVTGSFKDIDEIILTEEGVLSQYLDAHKLDFFVYFLKNLRVILESLPSGVGKGCQHEIDRHVYLLSA
jgi:hypothetical protein